MSIKLLCTAGIAMVVACLGFGLASTVLPAAIYASAAGFLVAVVFLAVGVVYLLRGD